MPGPVSSKSNVPPPPKNNNNQGEYLTRYDRNGRVIGTVWYPHRITDESHCHPKHRISPNARLLNRRPRPNLTLPPRRNNVVNNNNNTQGCYRRRRRKNTRKKYTKRTYKWRR